MDNGFHVGNDNATVAMSLLEGYPKPQWQFSEEFLNQLADALAPLVCDRIFPKKSDYSIHWDTQLTGGEPR